MRVVIHLALLGVLAGGLACNAADPAEPSAPYGFRALGAPRYQGPIVQVDDARSRILVQHKPAGASTGQVWISVRADTPMYGANGRAASRAALEPGVMVSVWSRQAIMESDPGQTGADAILIGE